MRQNNKAPKALGRQGHMGQILQSFAVPGHAGHGWPIKRRIDNDY